MYTGFLDNNEVVPVPFLDLKLGRYEQIEIILSHSDVFAYFIGHWIHHISDLFCKRLKHSTSWLIVDGAPSATRNWVTGI